MVVASGVSSSQRSFVTDPTATTILLVDGNDKDRTYYVDRIKSALPDYIVLEAKDGLSGLNLYHSRRVDCIVTELHLPDMSGFELLLEVNPHASKPEVAVIILARMAWRAVIDMAKDNGAQAFLVKRATAGEELIPVIQKAIATVRSRDLTSSPDSRNEDSRKEEIA